MKDKKENEFYDLLNDNRSFMKDKSHPFYDLQMNQSESFPRGD